MNQYDSPGIALADRSGADRRIISRMEEVSKKVVVVTGSRADVVKQIGNAVCPKMAEALASSIMEER